MPAHSANNMPAHHANRQHREQFTPINLNSKCVTVCGNFGQKDK
jgi:hypothetical protein